MTQRSGDSTNQIHAQTYSNKPSTTITQNCQPPYTTRHTYISHSPLGSHSPFHNRPHNTSPPFLAPQPFYFSAPLYLHSQSHSPLHNFHIHQQKYISPTKLPNTKISQLLPADTLAYIGLTRGPPPHHPVKPYFESHPFHLYLYPHTLLVGSLSLPAATLRRPDGYPLPNPPFPIFLVLPNAPHSTRPACRVRFEHSPRPSNQLLPNPPPLLCIYTLTPARFPQ